MPEAPPSPALPEDDRDALAGELALGLLRGDERAAALRLMVSDPDFAAAVEGWRLRLAPLLDDIAAAPAPDAAWEGIARRIANPGGAAVARWRMAALGASALAAGLAGVLLFQPPPAPPPAQPAPIPLLAQVTGDGGDPIVSAQYDARSGRFRVRTANLPAGARVPELWVIAGQAAPRSLGLYRLNGSSDAVAGPDLRRLLADGVTIAITLEPSTGPHAAPTGTILGTTKLVAL